MRRTVAISSLPSLPISSPAAWTEPQSLATSVTPLHPIALIEKFRQFDSQTFDRRPGRFPIGGVRGKGVEPLPMQPDRLPEKLDVVL